MNGNNSKVFKDITNMFNKVISDHKANVLKSDISFYNKKINKELDRFVARPKNTPCGSGLSAARFLR